MTPNTDTSTPPERFARPPVPGNVEELRVCAWAYAEGYDVAVEIGRAAIGSLRDQLAAALAQIEARAAQDAEDAAAWAEYLRQGTRGDTRSHLEVLRARGASPAEVAAAQANYERVWSGWPAARGNGGAAA